MINDVVQWLLSKNSNEDLKKLCKQFGISLPGFRVGIITPTLRPRLERQILKHINMKKLLSSPMYCSNDELNIERKTIEDLIGIIRSGKKPSIVFLKLLENDDFETANKVFNYFTIKDLNKFEDQNDPSQEVEFENGNQPIHNDYDDSKRIVKLKSKIEKLKKEITVTKNSYKELKENHKEEIRILTNKLLMCTDDYNDKISEYEDTIKEFKLNQLLLSKTIKQKDEQITNNVNENQKLQSKIKTLEKRLNQVDKNNNCQVTLNSNHNQKNRLINDSNIESSDQFKSNRNMSELILEEIKCSMYDLLSKMTFSNSFSVKKDYEKYFRFIESLIQLPYPLERMKEHQSNLLIHPTIKTFNQNNSNVNEPESLHDSNKVKDLERKSYRFERLLKGGRLCGINAYIPEWLVRELSLVHGDLVFAEKLNNTENPKYEYELAKSMGGKDPIDRVLINYAIVEFDHSLKKLVIQKTADNECIRIDDVPQIIILPDEDVNEYNIQEHDIIDLAFNKKNIQFKKIIWKYHSDKSIFHLPKQSKETKEQKDKKERETFEPLFKGKKILMIGYEPGKAAFREEVERRLGDLLFLTGDEQRDTFASTILKADVVIFMLEYVSHAATYFATEVCKENNIPFKGIHSFGRTSFIRTVEELIAFKNDS